MRTTNKIGIFGGSFNPVHKAHVAIAEAFIEKMGLDLLYVIPNNIPPLKETGKVLGEDRIEMLRIAFSGNDKIIISDIELLRPGVSYTCDTLSQLREIHPDDRIFLLTGDDWIEDFHKWKNYEYILKNAELVIAARSGKDITSALDRIEADTGIRPTELDNEITVLSSGEFRNSPRKELLPHGVFEYIQQRRLYGV